MKVVSSKQMASVESQACRDGSSEEDFMEEAGSGVALVAHDYAERNNTARQAILLCGKGNNGGDTYVAGVHLIHLDYDVIAYQLFPIEECSSLCRQNHQRFLNEGGRVTHADSHEEVVFPPHGLIIDGIFGTGFQGEVREPYASIIKKANQSGLPLIAVDIPSGLNGETGESSSATINAAETAFLSLPKTGFFLHDAWNKVGKLRYVDFGLPQEYIESLEAELNMLSADMLQPKLPPIKRNRHKYQAGYVVGLAGSPEMPGAAILSATAALKAGAGMMRLLHPADMRAELAACPFEIIKISVQYPDFDLIADLLNKGTAIYLGPGMGRSEEARTLFKDLLPLLVKPCVLDADALFFLAEEDFDLPPNTILTPHTGEMARLLKQTTQAIDKEFLKTCQEYVERKEATLVLKGGPTFIFHPNETMRVNPTGDPGMATAGSGDILTGLITGLLAQGISTLDAASLGVYLHGLAGEHAAAYNTSYCLMATDILYHFPDAFLFAEI